MKCFPYFYSQKRMVQKRLDAGLHPINELQRFRLLLCSLFCSVCVSVVYAFDLFTTEFSETFNLSPGDQSTISTVGVVFCYFALPYGILYDYCGPTSLFAIASVTSLVGCLCLGLVFDGKIMGTTATISVFYALMNTASGLLDSAAIVTLSQVFPRNRGHVVGLSKVMTGLGSSILASVSSNLFPGNVSGFIYFIMAFVVVVSIFAIFFITLPPYFVNSFRHRGKTDEELAPLVALKPIYHHKQAPFRRIVLGYCLVAAMLLFFTISSPIKAYTNVSRGATYLLGAITLILLAAFFCMILPIPWLGGVNEPITEEVEQLLLQESSNDVDGSAAMNLDKVKQPEAFVDEEQQGSTAPSPREKVNALEQGVLEEMEELPQDPRYGGTIWQILLSLNLWLLLVAFLFQGALGTMVMYNASTIYIASAGEPRDPGLSSLYTAFLGIGSAIGRIVAGLYEAYVQHQPKDKRRFVITLALPLAPLIAVVAGVLILVLPGKALLFPYILVYFEEGFFNGLRALIWPCLYQGHHGILYNMSFLCTVLCVICFNRFLFGYIVDAELKKLHYTNQEGCREKQCVRVPIIVATVVSAVAAVLVAIVHVRYTRFVRRCRALQKAAEDEAEMAAGSEANQNLRGEPIEGV